VPEGETITMAADDTILAVVRSRLQSA
jgi:hypothetical protein